MALDADQVVQGNVGAEMAEVGGGVNGGAAEVVEGRGGAGRGGSKAGRQRSRGQRPEETRKHGRGGWMGLVGVLVLVLRVVSMCGGVS